jgi:hypothetical protein
MPQNAVIAKNAPDMIKKIWEVQIGDLYNPSLSTLGGPWDRAYGFDMVSFSCVHFRSMEFTIRGLF